MSLSFIDIFCGAGGSSSGLTAAGYHLALGANHWARAIETHAANFPNADHLCADISNYDWRRMPRADVLWASPICTEISPAGGKKRRKNKSQMEMFEEFADLPDAAFERTRATAWCVIRATEVWRFSAVLVENVVEFCTDWELFDIWLAAMGKLGYDHQIVCASSAHVGGAGNLPAPQWRDRLYVVFLKKGVTMPDLSPRPLAWCQECGEMVEARQTWRRTAQTVCGWKVGKYGKQYDYTCPHTTRRHTSFYVEPFVRPAASVIDLGVGPSGGWLELAVCGVGWSGGWSLSTVRAGVRGGGDDGFVAGRAGSAGG
jgi:DNA (cytosine-5)-methyltransferase 1